MSHFVSLNWAHFKFQRVQFNFKIIDPHPILCDCNSW